ncbi:MAG: threonine--tRNA ligase [Clostridia bacterium]|nr:threonine--tRNA ligase [Clostridia bacterium]
MIKVTLKGDVIKEYEAGTSIAEIAKSIGMGLYKSACGGKINGDYCDLRTAVNEDCALEIVTFDEIEGKKTFWHTASHVMAQAVKRLYPDVKLAIGPSVDNGFYYDFDSEVSFTPEILEKIEAEMKKIVKEDLPLEKFELPPAEALAMMEEKGEIYKVELINEHADKGEPISFYKQGEFTELCAGPHLMSTGSVKAFKLTACTGAYWRGNEKNKMLQRIYATAFPKQSALDEHLAMLEEAKKRDHNKLGRELELFTTSELIGQGLPIMLPKGARIIQLLQRFVEDEEQKRGWLLTKTPFMAKSDLYRVSGHWDHYRDGMFVLGDADQAEANNEEIFALRPMTCPFQYQAYLNRPRSYRDLPLRYNETSTLFRNEASGEMHGLIRVRQFTISEGHLMCTPEQLEEEFKGCLELAIYMLKTLGLYEDVSYRFSQWDPADKEKYIGTPEQWDEAQGIMGKILDNLGIKYAIGVGEAAFYGPKLDIQIKNVFGKEDTLITIQVDQLLAEKFGMEYTDKDGSKKNPYIIHRTSIGCYERTLALLIEKYAGAFPLWLAPEQVRILPIADRHHDKAFEIKRELEKMGMRVTVDDRSEKTGYKIRESRLQKLPYWVIVGDKEVEDGTVSVSKRGQGDIGSMSFDDFANMLKEEIENKVR